LQTTANDELCLQQIPASAAEVTVPSLFTLSQWYMWM